MREECNGAIDKSVLGYLLSIERILLDVNNSTSRLLKSLSANESLEPCSKDANCMLDTFENVENLSRVILDKVNNIEHKLIENK